MGNSSNDIQLIAIDYDGTLAGTDSLVAEDEAEALRLLGEKKVLRVLATGRSIYSAKQVFDASLPLDYMVFSSGVGIMDWKTGNIIHKNLMNESLARQMLRYLLKHDLDFTIHQPAPDNHNCWYHLSKRPNPDFVRRIKRYAPYTKLIDDLPPHAEFSQFIIIVEQEAGWVERIRMHFPGLHVIRTTSPMDHVSTWIEVFPKSVSKGHALEYICSRHGIAPEQTMSIGNDYNDLDMLNFTGKSFVMGNAPKALKEKFPVIKPNHSNGVSQLVYQYFQ